MTTGGGHLEHCPFLALWVQEGAANSGKVRHKAKVKSRLILLVETHDWATCRKVRPSAANVV